MGRLKPERKNRPPVHRAWLSDKPEAPRPRWRRNRDRLRNRGVNLVEVAEMTGTDVKLNQMNRVQLIAEVRRTRSYVNGLLGRVGVLLDALDKVSEPMANEALQELRSYAKGLS